MKTIKIILLLFIVLSIASCNFKVIPQGKDDNGFFIYKNECLKEHEESYTFYILAGNVMIPQTGYRYVCDSSAVVKKYLQQNEINNEWLKDFMLK